jgi:hypothetical protein
MKATFHLRAMLVPIAILLLAAVSIRGSSSYFISNAIPAKNEISFGYVTMNVVEDEDSWSKGETAVARKKAPISKTPRINYTGNVDAYVRMIVSGLENYDVNISSLWTEIPQHSGIYYYSKIVHPDDPKTADVNEGLTEPIFQEVTLKDNYNGYGYDLNIVIYGEAVQANFVDYNTGTAKSAYEAFSIFNK